MEAKFGIAILLLKLDSLKLARFEVALFILAGSVSKGIPDFLGRVAFKYIRRRSQSKVRWACSGSNESQLSPLF